MRSVLSLMVVCALLLSGCAQKSQPVQAVVDCEYGVLEDESCAPQPAKPEPVQIEAGSDLLEGIDKTWSWEIGPGVQRFAVELWINGPSGAPGYEIINYYVALGRDSRIEEEAGCFQSVCSYGSVGGNEGICLICWSPPLNEDGTPDEAATVGKWTLTFTAERSPASYTASVNALYDIPTRP